MRRLAGLLAGTLGGILEAVSGAPLTAQQLDLQVPPLATTAAPLVLRGATVIDVRTGRSLPNRTVVIAGTRIQAMGRTGEVRVPRTARVVDARGKYLIPGLWDMHVHLQEYADVTYPLLIANGVTGVRDAGSEAPLATLGQWKREIAAGTRVGPRLIVSGPQIVDAPDTQTTVTQKSDALYKHQLQVPLAAARRVVDSLKAAGADMLKTYMGKRELGLAVIAEAKRVGIRFGGHSPGGMSGQEFSDSGATFIDHSAINWETVDSSVCGESATDDAPLAHFDAKRCAAAIGRLRRNHTWVTVIGGMPGGEFQTAQLRRYIAERGMLSQVGVKEPNVRRAAEEESRDSVAAAQLPPSSAAWEELIAKRAATEGLDSMWISGRGRPLADSLRKYHIRLPIVIGTDAGYFGGWSEMARVGFTVHEALLMLAQRQRISVWHAAYVQPTLLAALQTATLNPVLALQVTDSLGSVSAGKLADLVLLDADPLQDIWNTTKIRAVIANGRYYDRVTLDALLEAAHQAAVAVRAQSSRHRP